MLNLVSKQTPDSSGMLEAEHNRKRFQLAELLRNTEDMFIAAKKGEWETVEALEQSRKPEIIECFNNLKQGEAPIISEAVATLVYLNEQIVKLVEKAKKEIVNDHQELESGKSAVLSYQSFQDDVVSR